MNKYEKALSRIKKNVVPQADCTAEDMEHCATILEALETCAAFVHCDECRYCTDNLWCTTWNRNTSKRGFCNRGEMDKK